MFTGIVDHVGKITQATEKDLGKRLCIDTQFESFEMGESICVNGICLTVTEFKDTQFSCDLSPETLECTTAREWTQNTPVNLERSLRPTDRMGGHFVMGHVDGLAQLEEKTIQGDFWQLRFGGLNELAYFAPKGSVSVDGVSLTINRVTEDGFEVMLVPHTLERTQLGQLKLGGRVNIEFDTMARYAVQAVRRLHSQESGDPHAR